MAKTFTNQVTSAYSGVIRGKATGIAGCATSAICSRKDCIRADAQLAFRTLDNCDGVRFYVPLVEVRS